MRTHPVVYLIFVIGILVALVGISPFVALLWVFASGIASMW